MYEQHAREMCTTLNLARQKTFSAAETDFSSPDSLPHQMGCLMGRTAV